MKPAATDGSQHPGGRRQPRPGGGPRPWPVQGGIGVVYHHAGEQPRADERPSPGAVDGRIMIVYTGPSMNPTLVAPLLVEVQAYPDAQTVQPGDVVYFLREGEATGIIHRVLRRYAEDSGVLETQGRRGSGRSPGSEPGRREGIRAAIPESLAAHEGMAFVTRGDNNGMDDKEPVPFAQILGKVVAARRGTKTWPVAAGRTGLALHYVLRVRKRLVSLLARIGRAPWLALIESGFVARLLPRRFAPRVIAFQQGGRQVVQLYIGAHPAGVWHPETGQWQIRRAFRLLVDTRRLPRGEISGAGTTALADPTDKATP